MKKINEITVQTARLTKKKQRLIKKMGNNMILFFINFLLCTKVFYNSKHFLENYY